MSFLEILRVAFASIRATKLRSLLTTLGIVVGVAAVITMVALGAGAQAAVASQLEALGTDLLTVSAGQSYSRGVASAERVSLTSTDAEALRRDVPDVLAVVPILANDLQVKFGNQNVNVEIVATPAEAAAVDRLTPEEGRFFTEQEDQARRLVAVLGSDIPRELEAESASLVGQQVFIRGIPFEVIGILERKGDQPGIEPDESIYIPFRTGEYRIFGSDRINNVTIQMARGTSPDHVVLDIERILRREHRLRPDQPNDFRIRDRSEFLVARAEASRTLTFLLAGIAAVSLIVGGIGIMNIMLVSVTERTREIGVRLSVGARDVDVLRQFLVEALVLSLAGGAIGVALGFGASWALSTLMQWSAVVTGQAVLMSFGCAAAIGIFFGYYPARKAAALHPIDALRFE